MCVIFAVPKYCFIIFNIYDAEYNVQKYERTLHTQKNKKIDEFILRMCLDSMISDGHVKCYIMFFVMAIEISFSNCELDI